MKTVIQTVTQWNIDRYTNQLNEFKRRKSAKSLVKSAEKDLFAWKNGRKPKSPRSLLDLEVSEVAEIVMTSGRVILAMDTEKGVVNYDSFENTVQIGDRYDG